MKIFTLYPLLLCWVLLVAGCGGEPTDDDATMDRTRTSAAAPPHSPANTPDANATTVLVLGNSITAGYGLDPEQAFPALLQQMIDSLGWNVKVINAGLSGETTAGGLSRLDWLLRQPVNVLVIELGGNDGLRGIAPEVTRKNLQAIIDQTRDKYPEAQIILAGMQIPPNLGPDYTERFRSIYPELAEKNNVSLIPFLLEGVGGVRALNQADGIHPTAAGHKIVAENVWQTLKPILAAREAPQTAAGCEAAPDLFAADTLPAECAE